MKKIYSKPQMELTECVMLRSAVCSNTAIQDNNKPGDNGGDDPFVTSGAPGRGKVF